MRALLSVCILALLLAGLIKLVGVQRERVLTTDAAYMAGYLAGARDERQKIKARLAKMRPSQFWGHNLLSTEELQRLDNTFEEFKRRM